MSGGYSGNFLQRQCKIQLSRNNSRQQGPEECIFQALKELKTQNFGNHGPTSRLHWVYYKPPILSYSEIGMYESATNHILFSLKTFFMIRYKFRTQELQHLQPHEIQPLYPSLARWKMSAFFYIPARFHIPASPLNSSLPSVIEDYNPSHKLLTKLQTLTNFSRRLKLTMLHWKLYLY